MQQQLFKHMQAKPQTMRTRHSSGLQEGGGNHHPTFSFFQNVFQFTQQQAQSIQAKLPKGFFLIGENPRDFQKIREELRNSIPKIDSFQGKAHIMEKKKAQKKMQGREKLKNMGLEKKPKIKDNVKPGQIDKLQKSKKEPTAKKKTSLKMGEPKKQSADQISEYQSQQEQFQMNENKQTKKAIMKNKQKEKQREREKPKEKQKKEQKDREKEKQKEVKEPRKTKQIIKQLPKQHFPAKEKSSTLEIMAAQETNNNFSQSMMINGPTMINQQLQKPYTSIPNLSSGLPRYDPIAAQTAPLGTIETNSLRFLLGLPYGIPIVQNIPKLNEKQKIFCYNILHKLKNHKSAQAFKIPVDPQTQGVPDYYMAVYNPMDLHTIFKKLKNDKYHEISQFHADINRIFLNSYKYNHRETSYFKSAIQIQDYYHFLLKQAEEKPEEYIKEIIPRQTKVKKVDDVGELDFTQNTPIKQKKKKESTKPLLTKSQILDKGKGAKLKSSFPDFSNNFESMISEFNNELHQQNPSTFPAENNLAAKKYKLKKFKSSMMGEQDFSSVVSHIQNNDGQVHGLAMTNFNKQDSLNGDEEYENPFKSKWPPKKKKKEALKQKVLVGKKEIIVREESKVEKKIEAEVQKKVQVNQFFNKPSEIVRAKVETMPIVNQNKGKTPMMVRHNSQNFSMIPEIGKKVVKSQEVKQQKPQSKALKKQKNINKMNDDYNDDDDLSVNSSEMEVEQNELSIKGDDNGQIDLQNMRISMDFINDVDQGKSTNVGIKRNENYLDELIENKEDKFVQPEQKIQQLPKQKVQKFVFENKAILAPSSINQKFKEMEERPKSKNLPTNQHLNSDIIINTMVLGDPKQAKNSIRNQSASGYQQSITVNNLNTHPPTPALNNFDVILEQPSSTAPTMILPASYPKTKTIAKTKIKNKNSLDQEYRASSDDQSYVEPKYRKRLQKKKKQKIHHPIARQNSNSIDTNSIPKKRGRHPKKLIGLDGLDLQNNTTQAQKSSQISDQNLIPGEISNPNHSSLAMISNLQGTSSPPPIAHSQESSQHSYDNIKYNAQIPITSPSNIFIDDRQPQSGGHESGINISQIYEENL